MEGFVHQTRAQRLEGIRDSLRRAYLVVALTTPDLFEERLRRLEAAEEEDDEPQ
jgi:hypothetical protein